MNNDKIFSLIVSNSNLNFFCVDLDYKYTNFSLIHSQVIKNIWGVDIKTGFSILDIITKEEDRLKAKENFDKVIQNNKALILDEEYGSTLLHKNYYQNKYFPLSKNKKIIGVLVIVEEILINKDINIFEQIVNLSQSGITLADARDENHPLIFVNSGFSKLTGYSSDEALGRNCRFLQNDDINQQEVMIIKEALKNKTPCNVELRNYKKDGTLFYNLLVISPIFNTQGELIYFAGIQNDITELKKLEEQAFYKDKTSSMKNLIKNISHQWRQPLSLISTLSSGLVLKNDCDILSSEDIKTCGNEITTTAKYLSSILNQFSELLIDEPKSTFSLFELFDKNCNSLDVNFLINCEKTIYITSYKNMFEKIINNLIENSIIALENIEEKFIFIDVVKIDNHLNITIKDNANGIEETLLKNIFEPYFTTHHQAQGKGLGLYIVDNFIQNIGGRISIKNASFTHNDKQYKGLISTIVLPL